VTSGFAPRNIYKHNTPNSHHHPDRGGSLKPPPPSPPKGGTGRRGWKGEPPAAMNPKKNKQNQKESGVEANESEPETKALPCQPVEHCW
jgi:hypothetical protein